MSLEFDANTTDKVTVTNPHSIGAGSAFSWLMWIKRTAALTNAQGFSKGSGTGLDYFVNFSGFFAEVPRATTTAQSVISSTILVQSVWEFMAGTYDETDGIRFFNGSLSAPLAEVSYSSRTIGAGNTTANSGDIIINNRGSTNSLSMPCRIATFAWFDRRLSLAELLRQQFAPMPDRGCKFFSHMGLTENTVPDWSGLGNNGVPTGTVIGENDNIIRTPNPLDRYDRQAARQLVLV